MDIVIYPLILFTFKLHTDSCGSTNLYSISKLLDKVFSIKATPQPAKGVCKEKCQVCGLDTGEIHWAVSADGLTVLCPAAIDNPKKYGDKAKEVQAEVEIIWVLTVS